MESTDMLEAVYNLEVIIRELEDIEKLVKNMRTEAEELLDRVSEPQISKDGRLAIQIPIEELSLSTRAYNALKRTSVRDFNTVADLLKTTELEFCQIHNFGKTSFKEMESKVKELGFRLPVNKNKR